MEAQHKPKSIPATRQPTHLRPRHNTKVWYVPPSGNSCEVDLCSEAAIHAWRENWALMTKQDQKWSDKKGKQTFAQLED